MSRAPLLLSLLAACIVDPPDSGTAVGNPTGLTVDTAPGTGVSIVSATADVARVVTTSCAGEERAVAVVGSFDLLGGRAVDVPLGDACAVRVEFAGPLVFAGQGPDDSSFTLALSVASLELALTAPPGDLPRAVLLLGEAGWVSDARLGLDPGETVVVGADDPLHDTLVDGLVTGTAVYRDADGDGRCEEDCEPDDRVSEAPDDEEGDTDVEDTDPPDTGADTGVGGTG